MHSTSRRAILTAGIVSAGALAIAQRVVAQDRYPSRPIEFVVPWGPGGGADALARKAGSMLEESLKVSFPVINIPGATGRTGLNKMLAAPADGYMISIMTGDTFGLLASPGANWNLDQITPVAIMIRQSSAFLVAENGPIKTWADLEREAKTRSVKVAVTGFGSPDDMTVNFFVKRGMKLVSVPFAKPGERYSAVLGGHADVLYEQPGDVRNFIDTRQMQPVLLFGEKRYPAFPDVPASRELGFDITMPQFRMITVKAGTDPQRVKLLSDELQKVAQSTPFMKYLDEQLAEADSYVPASGALAFLRGELEEMRKHATGK